jgi:hypothetical protein
MRAIVCEALGDPCKPLGQGVLRLAEDAPEPAMKPGHVRIRVAAAGLNFPDALMIKVQPFLHPLRHQQQQPPLFGACCWMMQCRDITNSTAEHMSCFATAMPQQQPLHQRQLLSHCPSVVVTTILTSRYPRCCCLHTYTGPVPGQAAAALHPRQ